MRKAMAFTLAVVLVFQAFYNAWVTLYWVANRTYIARTLCEKKDASEEEAACCQGKCYLRKNLVTAQEQPATKEAPKAPVYKKSLEQALCEAIGYPHVGPVVPVRAYCFTPYVPHSAGRLRHTDIFHPPPVAVGPTGLLG